MTDSERRIQTQVKHKIQTDYLTAWQSIIVGGLSSRAIGAARAGRAFHSRLIYVDGFSFRGRYSHNEGRSISSQSAEGREPIWGSPIIGVRALDQAAKHAADRYGFSIGTASILVEQRSGHFERLLESLQLAGIHRERIVINPKVIQPRDGDVLVINADFLECYCDIILPCLQQKYTKSFVLLDPYGMKGIPYDMVKRFVSLPNADIMINWPFLDIQRKQGRFERADERSVAGDEAILANIDEMFGTEQWKRFCSGRPTDSLPENVRGDLEVDLANLYQSQLQEADSTVTVKRVPLRFSDRDRTIYYLFLTTHDPSGALELNEVLDRAKLLELGARWHLDQDRYVHMMEAKGQTPLFDFAAIELAVPNLPERNVDISRLGQDVHRLWAGMSPTRKEVYRSQANTAVYKSEIDRALTWLKKQGMVDFDSGRTKISDRVRFVRSDGWS